MTHLMRGLMHAKRTDRRILVTVAGLGIAERRVRARDVWAACLCAWWLDRRLSAGEPAESSAQLAVRAEWLVRPASRRELAKSLLRVLALAAEPSRAPLTVRIASGRVRAAAWELRGLVDRLLAEGPVSAYGVAKLRALLADGGGPLYHAGSTEDLVTRLRDVRYALDRLGTESRSQRGAR